MTEAMPFLQKYDITFLRPPTIIPRVFFCAERAESPLCRCATSLPKGETSLVCA